MRLLNGTVIVIIIIENDYFVHLSNKAHSCVKVHSLPFMHISHSCVLLLKNAFKNNHADHRKITKFTFFPIISSLSIDADASSYL